MAKIMVVDDDPDILHMVKVILGKGGHTVVTCSSGAKGIESLENSRPDLILLDIMMPEMDGWDVLKEMRRRDEFRHIPVAMLTVKSLSKGTVGKRDIKGLLEYVVRPFTRGRLTEDQLIDRGSRFFWIDKPFTREDLLARVETIQKCVQQ